MLIDGVEIRASSRGKRACQLIALEEIRKARFDVVVEQIDVVIERVTALR